MNKKTIMILSVALLLIVAFIWGNSVLSPTVSEKISRAVGGFLSGVVGTGDETVTVGGLSVRKAGHFFEFFALGVVSWLLAGAWFTNKPLKALVTALMGISVPLIDETVQIFSGRGHSVKDVWIDIAGFSVGVGVVLLVSAVALAIGDSCKNKHKK